MSYNQLSEAEKERLALLAEEMGEAIQVIGKILRHGFESYHPDDPAGATNRELLQKELGDVRFAVELMCCALDIDRIEVMNAIEKKGHRARKFLHYQRAKLLDQVQESFVK